MPYSDLGQRVHIKVPLHKENVQFATHDERVKIAERAEED